MGGGEGVHAGEDGGRGRAFDVWWRTRVNIPGGGLSLRLRVHVCSYRGERLRCVVCPRTILSAADSAPCDSGSSAEEETARHRLVHRKSAGDGEGREGTLPSPPPSFLKPAAPPPLPRPSSPPLALLVLWRFVPPRAAGSDGVAEPAASAEPGSPGVAAGARKGAKAGAKVLSSKHASW
jgi:hypothetical protein